MVRIATVLLIPFLLAVGLSILPIRKRDRQK